MHSSAPVLSLRRFRQGNILLRFLHSFSKSFNKQIRALLPGSSPLVTSTEVIQSCRWLPHLGLRQVEAQLIDKGGNDGAHDGPRPEDPVLLPGICHNCGPKGAGGVYTAHE